MEKKNNKTTIYTKMAVVLGVLCVIFTVLYIQQMNAREEAQQKLDELSQMTAEALETAKTDTELQTKTAETIETQEQNQIPEKNLDWDALTKENKDIYAWIYIPDTNIDYPILQHESDDTYYLEHNIDGSTGYPGCIYSERINSKYFNDANTVLYGHNMKNGSMFADLHNFEDKEYFDENQYIYIYTPTETLLYEIFAAYEFSDDHILMKYDFQTEEGRTEYLDEVRNVKDLSAHFRDGITVDTDSQLLTLSTCYAGRPNNRYIVQGVMVE